MAGTKKTTEPAPEQAGAPSTQEAPEETGASFIERMRARKPPEGYVPPEPCDDCPQGEGIAFGDPDEPATPTV